MKGHIDLDHRYGVGELVSAAQTLLDDGTFPESGIEAGDVLVPDGTVGQVMAVGVYLGEHTVYAVAFGNGRLVGCLEPELAAVATPAAFGGAT